MRDDAQPYLSSSQRMERLTAVPDALRAIGRLVQMTVATYPFSPLFQKTVLRHGRRYSRMRLLYVQRMVEGRAAHALLFLDCPFG